MRLLSPPLLLMEVRLFKSVCWILPRSMAMLWAYSIADALAEQEARGTE